jgi:hypothetical protein
VLHAVWPAFAVTGSIGGAVRTWPRTALDWHE